MSQEQWVFAVLAVLAGLLALAMLVGAVLLAVRVVRTRRMLGTLGVGGKVAFWGALVYTVFPVDVLPDPIYLDDIGVLAAALLYLGRLVQQHRAAERLPGGPEPHDDHAQRPVS
ncbi:YkvA family protein [Micromonospora okii]|uniref:YkvA family protein n=1 Tax=Micromonospora okii TaxID=1182970 RepID=UPI001E4F3C40|nr:YkvA family protein [Micromonospora okii]